ncbi:5'-3' exonuclease [Microbacterium sp. ARD31]|uniref:5'-3' exonuclease n=1 Tax=Microbacterium sp. ARD31 TaxID=2962576 RepID=UPI002882C236|nr:5'-3' exonuclease [Microbacterium sp. ARD31]MDT0186102.1 5'-3' exonuclease [Microbacterium sp. ARD31]
MTDSGQRLLLLDTASLYFRAFFGVPDSMKAPDGTPVNAVRGLMDFISRLVGEYDPTHFACCWDDDWRPQWRVDLIPSYKAHRVVRAIPGPRPDVEEVPDPLEAQVPIIREVLGAYGIPVVGHAEMEADDVIGTLATDAGLPVDIVTGDRDLFQLVDDDAAVRVLYVARGVSRHERVDNAWVRGKYGVDARQYADLATLRGDASDGLPGVAGVGDKTAATLLNRFGTIRSIIEAAHDPESDMGPGPRGKIKAAADYLAVAPRVVAVRRDLDLGSPDLTRPRTPADHAAVVALDERWGLGSSAVRLVEALSGSH